jgi:hypothetical protein
MLPSIKLVKPILKPRIRSSQVRRSVHRYVGKLSSNENESLESLTDKADELYREVGSTSWLHSDDRFVCKAMVNGSMSSKVPTWDGFTGKAEETQVYKDMKRETRSTSWLESCCLFAVLQQATTTKASRSDGLAFGIATKHSWGYDC